jgi:hypothetical protein
VHNRVRAQSDRRGPVSLESGFPGPGSRTWQPARALVALGAAAVVAILGWAMLSSTPLDRLVAVVVAIALGGITAIGWRRRLIGGPRGLLIRGLRGSRMVPWSQVRTVDAATSRRAGLTSTTLEIDLIDDDLLVFGRTDLGTDPAEVLAVLHRWWCP